MRSVSHARPAVKSGAKRAYDVSGRQATALKTRRRILDSAQKLFLDRGYASTSMNVIAETAGVSIETIYLSIGSKGAIVRFLVERALSGEDTPVPASERKGTMEIMGEARPDVKVRMFAGVVRRLQERLGPIWAVVREAAPGDAELQSFIAKLNERHVGNMRLFVEHLAAAGALRQRLSRASAGDVVWAMNSPEFYRLLVIERGWSGDAFERFLGDALQRLLLTAEDPSEPQSPGRA
ncbi:MAG: TetR/AcrR family transcriptional regulator [Vicinamibacterales bacterium]